MLTPSAGNKSKGISRQNPRYTKPKTSKGTVKNSKTMRALEKKQSHNSILGGARDHRGSSVMETDSLASKASWFGNVANIGKNVYRSSRNLFKPGKKGYKTEADEFFFTNARNQWRADKSAVFKCSNGQDCIGVASHKNWEVFVLCDGHDQDGHLVAQGVCATLPHFLLRRVMARKTEFTNRAVEDSIIIDAFKEVESTVCWSSTNEFEIGDYVKVTSGELQDEIGYIANFVEDDSDEDEEDEDEIPQEKIKGKKSGRIIERDEKVTVVIDNHLVGYNRIIKKESEILSPRYKGGSTCLCFIRNFQTNKCKVAVLGDSRLMLLGEIGKKFRDEDFIDPVLMTTYVDTEEDELEGNPRANKDYEEDMLPIMLSRTSLDEVSKGSKDASDEIDQIGFFTPQHNVYNGNERDRLKAYQKKMNGEYVVNLEDGYLVNPDTKMQIQPTRGFGDVEMQGSGYIHIPEISSLFTLAPNTILVAASDGVFDGDIWGNDEEFLKYIYDMKKKGVDTHKLVSSVYDETIKRVADKSGLDDISMFGFISPQVKKRYRRRHKPKVKTSAANGGHTLKNFQSTRTMKSRRTTIQRVDRPGAHLFRKFFSRKTNILD